MTFAKPSERKMSARSILFCLLTLFLLALFIKNPQVASEAVRGALKTCGHMLLPSLFPLTVISEIAMESGYVEGFIRPISKIVAKIFGLKKEAATPLVLGLVCGYTASLNGALSLYRDGVITKSECEKIISLASLPSLSFFSGVAGTVVLGSARDGFLLWAIAVFSALALGFLTRKSAPKSDKAQSQKAKFRTPQPLAKTIVGAISHSAYSMLLVCACVVFFCSLIAVLRFALDGIGVPEVAREIILGSLEISNGVLACANIPSHALRGAACGGAIGWSGFSVHFQIISLCDGKELSFKKYFIFKILQGLLCALISFFVLQK